MNSWELVGSILNIYGNLLKQDCDSILEAIEKGYGLRQIQFSKKFKVSADTLKFINHYVLKKYPEAPFRLMFNDFGALENLSLMEELPLLKDLRLEINRPLDLSPIQKHLKLESLSVGGKHVDLSPLLEHKSLRKLFLFKKIKNLDVLAQMTQLNTLSFSQIPVSLSILKPLTELQSLSFYKGSIKNWDVLPSLNTIERLSFVNVRGLKMEHLDFVNQMQSLKHLYLDQQPNITHFKWLNNSDIRVEPGFLKNLLKNPY